MLNRFFVRADGCAGARFQGFGGADARVTTANTPTVHALLERLCDGPTVGPAREQTVLIHDFARERRFAARAVAAPSLSPEGRAALWPSRARVAPCSGRTALGSRRSLAAGSR